MAFATVSDLEARLGRELTPTEAIQAEALLDDATAYLRAIIGSDVAPQTTSTVVVHLKPGDDTVGLPSYPVVSVDEVSIDGTAVDDWELVDHRLWRIFGWPVANRSRYRGSPVTIT